MIHQNGRVYSAIYNKLILDMNPYEALNSSCQRKLSTLLVITCACLIHCPFNVPLSRVLLSDMILVSFSNTRMVTITITRCDYNHMLSIWELVPICKSYQTLGFGLQQQPCCHDTCKPESFIRRSWGQNGTSMDNPEKLGIYDDGIVQPSRYRFNL